MLLSLVRTYMRPYAGAIAVIIAFQAVQALANLYLPGLNADIIDNGIVTGDTTYILQVGAVMLGVTALQVLAAIVAVYYGARTAMAFGRDLREATFDKVQTFAAEEVGRFGAPTLITRTTNDVQQVQLVTFMFFAMLIAAPIMGIGGIVMAMRQDLGLSWLIAVAVPVLVVAVTFIISRMRPHFRKMQTRIDAINRVLREQIMGIQVIRAFVKTDYERRRFEVANDDYREVAVRAGQWMSLMFPTVMLVMNVSSVAVIWFGGHRVADGTLEVGTLTAYLTYLVQILMAVMMATFLFVLLPRAEVSAERIHEVLDTEPSVTSAPDAVDAPVREGRIELRDVAFSYPDAEEPVLRGVDLVARPGETTAIIGSTGSGKSTLLNLVPRLFDATGGQVLLDGVDVRDRVVTQVWSSMGLVPQRAFLFAGTVATNLRMGDPHASDEALWEALEIAQAREFVESMPGGLDASVVQGGTNVSGGQRQRLAIARAIVARPRVYLFDDSFSALDFATDAALRRALRTVTTDASVIVVAQRVSTIRDADRIVVLDEGRAVGTGRHHELMDTCETYREIVLSQLTEEEAA